MRPMIGSVRRGNFGTGESRSPPSRRARPVEKKHLPAGPAPDLRNAVYQPYAEADRPLAAHRILGPTRDWPHGGQGFKIGLLVPGG
jgi:hypothetical protein